MDPSKILPSQGPLEEEIPAMNIIKGVSVKTPVVPTVTNATDAQVPTQASAAINVDQSMTNSPGAASSQRSLRMSIDYYNQLPTPILVDKLESALSGHPDSNFVFQVCNNLRFGARIGFEGQRAPKFSRNLPTALADPSVVTNNLAHEISLGRVAGPYDNPPFPNFQISPIGLVPKN
jgi:hypothetical protein